MEQKTVLYENKEYPIVDILSIKDMDFVIYQKSAFQYAYLKRNLIEERFVYVPFDVLMKVLPQYQKVAYQNIKNLLDAFITLLNQRKDIRFLKEHFFSILNRNCTFFEEQNIHELSVEYFIAFFENESLNYHRKNVADFFPLDASKKEMENNKIRFPFAKFAYMVLVAISTIMFMEFYGVYSNWKEEGKETQQLTEELLANTIITEEIVKEIPTPIEDEFEVPDDSKTPTGVIQKDKYGKDYWNYMNIPMMNVDFSKLKKENPDTVGWLFVNNTNINYPFVQTTNNTYYLDKAFDRTKNAAGWLFADYRSDLTNFKRNTVIYGHGRVDQVMFGSLEKTLDKSWYTNKENQIIKLSTPSKNTLWQIVSIYTIEAEAYYLTHNFENDASYQKYLDTILSRSKYNFDVEVSTEDKILTLSTCLNYNGERIVVHAKLVKTQDR